MSRAFVSERDGWNLCRIRGRHCMDADLRGECERSECKYPPEKEESENRKAEKDRS